MTTPAATMALSALVASTIAAGVAAAITHQGTDTRVLGEKIVGAGSSTNTPGNNGNSGNGNNGNGSTPMAKTFTISGAVDDFYPGKTVLVALTTTNDLNQDLTVKTLSASVESVVETGSNAAGSCTPNISIDAWTGRQFDLPKKSTVPVPGVIPITLSSKAPDACQGAKFTFSYSGTAVQK